VGKILIRIARTIVVQGKLPALLKSPFFFKTFSVQKKRGEGAGAPVGFFGDTGSEKTTQQVGLFPRVCSVCKSKSFLWHFCGIIDVLGSVFNVFLQLSSAERRSLPVSTDRRIHGLGRKAPRAPVNAEQLA